MVMSLVIIYAVETICLDIRDKAKIIRRLYGPVQISIWKNRRLADQKINKILEREDTVNNSTKIQMVCT